MSHLIVERTFEEPLTTEEPGGMAIRLAPCLEQYGARWIRSYLSTDRRRMICEFEAPDAEAVRMAHRTAGVRFDRVWNADLLAPESEPSA